MGSLNHAHVVGSSAPFELQSEVIPLLHAEVAYTACTGKMAKENWKGRWIPGGVVGIDWG